MSSSWRWEVELYQFFTSSLPLKRWGGRVQLFEQRQGERRQFFTSSLPLKRWGVANLEQVESISQSQKERQ